MTTKELIELLQKTDPEGTHHVRIRGGGCPVDAIVFPGYYDGSYSYYDEENNFVVTSSGVKVDIFCTDWQTVLWDRDGDYSKIKIDMSAYTYKEKETGEWMDKLKKESEYVISWLKEFHEKIFNEKILPKFKEGWLAYDDKYKLDNGRIIPFPKWIREEEGGEETDLMICGAQYIFRHYKDDKHKNDIFYQVFEEFEKGGVRYWKLKGNKEE